ncbi:hypothetical protein B9N43_10675 [Denitratisoma sp. DHT3]|uniref:DHA2 family efflux MFS transporter permease subunit n=1 Tax=Denitratisoma sp. DHT3 TaxID=1981880 RepID=UPI0011985D82|nr:DHA2 family efflux MFS transporter permease subunit [Denitratisoma sp. DHT3]QDX81677.1 hypothetical protein B9N43_10675 [Denitratisoma sp. DHT3]
MAAADATHPPLPAGERLIATLAVSLAIFMYGLDMAVANVSIPAIAGDLGGSLSQGTWVITAYAVANAIVIPLTGWLTTRFGQVRLFVASVLLFTLASALCGLSTSLEMLVFFRGVQGFVAGPMNPLSMALLLSAYPPRQAAVAMAASMMTGMMSPALGPILGGWITDNLSWPWIFYINIPVGLFAAAVSWRIFRRRETPRVRQPVDYVGLALLVTWVGALQIMLDLGRERSWFESPLVVALGLVALAGFLFFLVWEWYEAHPAVELRLFKIPSFAVSICILAVVNVPYFGNVVLTPLWLQGSLGYTATLSGFVVMGGGLAMFFFQPVVGKLVPRLGSREFATLGLVILIVACYLRIGFTPDLTTGDLILPQVLQGLGTAAIFMPIVLLSLNGVPQSKVASASGLNAFARILATGTGTSIATSLWDQRTIHHHAILSERINPYNADAAAALGDLTRQFGAEDGLRSIDRLITSQAQTMAINDYNVFALVLFALCIVLIWSLRRQAAATHPVPAGDH